MNKKEDYVEFGKERRMVCKDCDFSFTTSRSEVLQALKDKARSQGRKVGSPVEGDKKLHGTSDVLLCPSCDSHNVVTQ